MNFSTQPEIISRLRENHQQLMSRIQVLATHQQNFVLDQLQQSSRKNRFRARSDDLSVYLKEIRDDIDRLNDEQYRDAHETIVEDLYKKFQYVQARQVYASKQRQYPE